MGSPKCPHGKRLVHCKSCPNGGKGLCDHGNRKERCSVCKTGGCPHGKTRKEYCMICSPHLLCRSSIHYPPIAMKPPAFAQKGEDLCTYCLGKRLNLCVNPSNENRKLHSHPGYINYDPECEACADIHRKPSDEQPPPTMLTLRPRCSATRRKGGKCKWFAILGSEFCTRHSPRDWSERCTHKTRRLKPCLARAIGNGRCRYHTKRTNECRNDGRTMNTILDEMLES